MAAKKTPAPPAEEPKDVRVAPAVATVDSVTRQHVIVLLGLKREIHVALPTDERPGPRSAEEAVDLVADLLLAHTNGEALTHEDHAGLTATVLDKGA